MIVQSLYASDRPFGRQLNFALLVVDHFTGQPVGEELSVTVDIKLNPVRTSDNHYRNSDGTYRFIDLPAGNHAVAYSSLTGRYVSFDSPLSVLTPIAVPQTAIQRDLWPTPSGLVPSGMTALRGSLQGAVFKDVKVEIAETGQPFDRYTRTDLLGNFLFLIPARLTPIAANDIHAAISVRLNGGAIAPQLITVTSNGSVTNFSGTTDFQIAQGAQSRVMLTGP